MENTKLYIILFVCIFTPAVLLFLYLFQKRSNREFETPEKLKEAPSITVELLNKEYALLAKEMQDIPILAFTQCSYIKSNTTQVLETGWLALRIVLLGLVGVRARVVQSTAVSFFVLSSDNLHFLTFDEELVEEHLIFTQDQLSQGKITKVKRSDCYQLSIDVEGKTLAFLVKKAIQDPIQSYDFRTLYNPKSTPKLQGKKRLMTLYFINKIKELYPNLTKL
ncbi:MULTISPECIES: hypothetical protein [unclassified Myroides]|uniref:hypothetical protein n=1 Tax=unclassified Myroides TaxID=2642485 RepID=UPI003D2F62BA